MSYNASSTKATEEIPPPPYEEHQHLQNTTRPSEKDDVPIVTMEPISFNGNVVNRSFMVYNEKFLHDILTFVSQDAREKYKTFKGLGAGSLQKVLDFQREGFAMPLLLADHHSLSHLHSTKYMTIYKYTPPPANLTRQFDKNIDRFVFCKVTKERCASYYKYKLTFTPDPKNPGKSFSLFMIEHHRHPIIDISEYNGRRFRFIYGHNGFRCKWSYELNILPDGQPSLVDGMGSDGKVKKDNPLLGSAWKNNLVPLIRSRGEFTGVPVGVALETLEYFHSMRFHAPVRFAFQDLMNSAEDVNRTESINTVGIDSLVFLCITSILKREEDCKESRNKNNHSGLRAGLFSGSF